MQHQQLVAPLGLRAPVGVQRMNGRAQVIGAVLARCAAYLPHTGLEAFNQRLEAFREADLDGLNVRVDQHQVIDQMRKRHPAQCDPQVVHVGKVRLSGFAWFMDLGEHHLTIRSVLRTPGGDVPLQGAQLPLLIATRLAFAQQSEQRLTLQRWVVLKQLGDPRPVVGKRVGPRAVRPRLLELAR